MKKIIIIFILFTLLICLGYILASSSYKIDENYIGIAKDRDSGEAILMEPGYNFIWQGIIPGRVDVKMVSLKDMEYFELKIMSESLEELKKDSYAVGININIIFQVDEKAIKSLYHSRLHEGAAIFREVMHRFLYGNFKEELSPYLYPRYRRSDILNDGNIIIEKAMKRFAEQCSTAGIIIDKYEIVGGFELPENDVFYEGILYSKEIREKEKNNKKELILLNGKLEREKNLNESYFKTLEEMSKIIRDNPDILKYIYIDKMADNVRVIVAPEKSGVPLGLGAGDDAFMKNDTGEIDNLR